MKNYQGTTGQSNYFMLTNNTYLLLEKQRLTYVFKDMKILKWNMEKTFKKCFWERNTQQKKILKSIWIEGEAKELNTTK
jgi:hypothetical protein